MDFRLNPSSGVPIYLQLMEQIKHGIETAALQPGDQLPGIRKLAESVVMNPNTVAKAYRELEHEGYIEVRHGAGAFISAKLNTRKVHDRMDLVRPLIEKAVAQAAKIGLSDEEIRRLVEAELLKHGGIQGTKR
jgi:GntR family transcriptional regulator